MARRPSTPRSFFVDEAAHPVEEEEEEQQQQRVLAVDTSRLDEGDGQSDSRGLQRSHDSAARDPSAIASPTPLPTALSPQQTLQADVSDSATTANTAAQPRRAPSLGYTDLDLFASRLADVRTAAPDGEDSGVASGDDTNNRRDTYDDLHLLAEFLGPAKAPGLTQEQMETLPVGRVEVLRRRVVGKRDDGRDKVKLALAVTGVKVERCGVCLVQFKEGNLACVFPCLHVLHEQCAIKLLRDTKVCPICRAPVIVEA